MAVARPRAETALWLLLAGLALLATEAGCLRGSALVAELKAKAKAALLNPSPVPSPAPGQEGASEDAVDGGPEGNGTATSPRPLLTGDPQKDYVYDPNLPRELNGYNLSTYPFYNGVPPDIHFDCDNLHDGFYASVPHKCQVYHHCLFGTRYDFLCANYTAFDQRTFICHFVSEVDCDNSPKFYQRNEALYKAASTSPPVTTTTTTPAPPPTTSTAPPATAGARRPPHRRRPPGRRRRPVYEYYEDDQYDDDEEYYDEEPPPPPPPTSRRKATRKHRPQGRHRDEDDDYYEERRETSQGESEKREQSSESTVTLRTGGPVAGTVYDRPRVPPKIRRPVPIHERDKYDYVPSTPTPTRETKKAPAQEEDGEEYYDDEYDQEYVKPTVKRPKSGSDSRRANGRYRPRQPSRRRPDRYEDDYEEETYVRPRKRTRFEDTRNRGSASVGHRSRLRDEPDPVPADRPGFISNTRFSTAGRKATENDRGQQQPRKKQPSRVVAYDDEYYDEDEEEEEEEGGGDKPEVRRSDIERDKQSATSRPRPVQRDNHSPKQDSDRERLFSSRFRDGQNESSKLKGKAPDNQFQGRPSSDLRPATQSTESVQRQVYVPRSKQSSEEYVTSQTKLPPLTQDTSTVEFSEEGSSGISKLSNFRSKGRPSAPNPISYTNTKSTSTARQRQETAEQLEPSSGREEPTYPSDAKSYAKPSPFSGTARRQFKTTTEPVFDDESPDFPLDVRDRHLEPITMEEKRISKPEYKDEGSKNVPSENQETPQVNSGRETRPVEDKSGYILNDRNQNKEEENIEENVKLAKPFITEKFQFSNPNVGVYRRVKVNTVAVTQAPQTDEPKPYYEEAQPAKSVNNNKRLYTPVRPFSPSSDLPISVEDTTKNVILSSGVPIRRPVKQRVEESQRTDPPELRQGSIPYFSPKRAKIRPDETLRGQDRYTKRLSLNGESQFSKQLPKIEITAPGPSAPDSDRFEIATIKSDYKKENNAASQGFTIDIPEEEYDVTLNDALQPSTLHPTRSLIDYRRAGPKIRDADYTNGGRAASVVAYRAVPPQSQQEYEAIVLTATGNDDADRSQRTEWFW